MSANPIQPAPEAMPSVSAETGGFEMIHLGDERAVVVPLADFRRLQALEQAASPEALEAAQDAAVWAEIAEEDAAGDVEYVSLDEADRLMESDG
jgi:hypothetical protein